MKKIILFCFILVLIGCSNRRSQSNLAEESIVQVDNVSVDDNEKYEQNDIFVVDNTLLNNIIEQEKMLSGDKILIDGIEILRWGNTVYNTYINNDNVNVHAYPSFETDILFEINENTEIVVFGVSKEIYEIDGFVGNWLLIRAENYQNWDKEGWVFSKYAANAKIPASGINIKELIPNERLPRNPRLIASYEVDGIEIDITLSTNRDSRYYVFSFEPNHFSNIPGTYILYPETNALIHMSYHGTGLPSAWIIFTQNFKYMLQDVGTGPDPRGLRVWRVDDGKLIFSGQHYGGVALRGYTIEVIYQYSNFDQDNSHLDVEIINFAEEFIERNPIPDGRHLMIICELNLETGAGRIIRGEYIFTQ